MLTTERQLKPIHPSWIKIVKDSLRYVDSNYLQALVGKMGADKTDWLPGSTKIFNAFSLDLSTVKYILFGESPYPRQESANGYAFWDAAVNELWSVTGLSKKVNRATSLRHIIKMLLVARGDLSVADTSQTAIAQIDKHHLVQTGSELFMHLQHKGILLLNASLVLSQQSVRQDAKAWLPFINALLTQLSSRPQKIELILLGRIAHAIDRLPIATKFKQFHAEHPYNVSFVTNPRVLDFFRPLNLLECMCMLR